MCGCLITKYMKEKSQSNSHKETFRLPFADGEHIYVEACSEHATYSFKIVPRQAKRSLVVEEC